MTKSQDEKKTKKKKLTAAQVHAVIRRRKVLDDEVMYHKLPNEFKSAAYDWRDYLYYKRIED